MVYAGLKMVCIFKQWNTGCNNASGGDAHEYLNDYGRVEMSIKGAHISRGMCARSLLKKQHRWTLH